MIEAVMCCAKCGGALKIVCDAHGTEFVPDRRMLPKEQTEMVARRPYKKRVPIFRPDSLRGRIRAALSPSIPKSAMALAEELAVDAKRVGIELANMTTKGQVVRAARGQYVCAP